MDRQVAEEKDIAGLGFAGNRGFDRVLVQWQVPAARMEMLDRTQFVAARDDAHAPFGERGVVEVDDGCDHRVFVVWKERAVLVHGEGGALFRRFDEQFVVVQLHIRGADDVCGDAGEPFIDDQPSQQRRLKLDVVAVQQRSFGHGHLACALPRGFDRRNFLQTVDQGMGLLAKGGGFFSREEPFDVQVTVFLIKIELFRREHAVSPGVSGMDCVGVSWKDARHGGALGWATSPHRWRALLTMTEKQAPGRDGSCRSCGVHGLSVRRGQRRRNIQPALNRQVRGR